MGGGGVPEEGEVGELIVSDLGEEVVLQVQNLQLAQPVQRPASDLERCMLQRRNHFFSSVRISERVMPPWIFIVCRNMVVLEKE